MSKYHSRLAVDSLTAENEQLELTATRKKSDTDLIFYIDNKGQEDQNEENGKTNEPINDAFVAAAHAMQSGGNGGQRKRRVGKSSEKKQVKYLKYKITEHPGSSVGKDGSSSESEVQNPASDEDGDDVEVKEQ